MFLFVYIVIVYSDWIVVRFMYCIENNQVIKVEMFALLISINKIYIA